MKRRDFLCTAAAAATLSACATSNETQIGSKDAPIRLKAGKGVDNLVVPKMDVVRFGFIGVGRRGETLLRLLLHVEGIKIVALCDTHEPTLNNRAAIVNESTGELPALYGETETSYKQMLERDDLDAVIIATPWKWHTPMALDVMNAGKHALVEVPAALTVEECWQLVEASERTQLNCMMLENVCYGRTEMMLLNMVRDNLFGEIVHGEAAYIHELRWQMKDIERGTGSWRTPWHTRVNGNLYPTHGLGPIAQYMNINRGDRFDYLVSTSSNAVGRQAYAKREFPADHPRNQAKYIAGDMNSTLIKTALGKSILVQHDTTTPRPYSRLNLIQGSNGIFAGFPDRIALENNPFDPDSPNDSFGAEDEKGFHKWDEDMDKWHEKYDHPIWRRMLEAAVKLGGHGGMDFVMLWRLVYCLRNGVALDQNVYDAAAWSAIIELSERSVNNRSASIDVPDFTGGGWKTTKPLVIGESLSQT